jgi:tRNA-dihydrouridine synthase B
VNKYVANAKQSFAHSLEDAFCDNIAKMIDKKASGPDFYVGGIPIYGDAILSPMDGFSDLPFRGMCRRLGSAMSYTGFISASEVINDRPHLDQRLAYEEYERPVVFQLFGDDPDRLVEAATRLLEREPDIIDVNMGCPFKSVARRGAGAGLLKNPEKIATIFQKLTREVDIPVTGKIRLGWDDDSQNYLEVAQTIEENGGQLIAVHGRTKEQNYSGEANWEAIAEIKEVVSIPVIGNGDVKTPADINRMKDETGCDAVMVGRAAIGNPWIFAGLDRWEVPLDQVRATMLQHLDDMLNFYGEELGLIFFRKHATQYISPYRLKREQRARLLRSETPQEFTELLDQISFANQPMEMEK